MSLHRRPFCRNRIVQLKHLKQTQMWDCGNAPMHFTSGASLNRIHSLLLCSNCITVSGLASPKFWGSKMLDFRRATVFLFGTPYLKAQNDQICWKLGVHGPRLRIWHGPYQTPAFHTNDSKNRTRKFHCTRFAAPVEISPVVWSVRFRSVCTIAILWQGFHVYFPFPGHFVQLAWIYW